MQPNSHSVLVNMSVLPGANFGLRLLTTWPIHRALSLSYAKLLSTILPTVTSRRTYEIVIPMN